MPESYTARGFASYADGIETTYGDVVSVYESSAAVAPHIWISIQGRAHLTGDPEPHVGISHGIAPGSMAAHMTVAQATRLQAALAEAIAAAENE